jgi:hypothetical protein
MPSLFEERGEVVPEGGAAGFDFRGDAANYAVVADVVFAPALALVVEIEQDWHGSIDGVGEAGLGGLGVFKLLP